MNWISAKDCLPETVGYSVEYLVFTEDGDFHVVSWMNIGGWCWADRYAENITHWMKLEEPKGQAQEPDEFPGCHEVCTCECEC